MRQTAAAISVHTAPRVVSPKLLELTLFGLDLTCLPAGGEAAVADADLGGAGD
jgi:hypothetical protein